MFQRTEIDCPALAAVADRFRSAGEFVSVFFRVAVPVSPSYPNFFERSFSAVLNEVLQSSVLVGAAPELAPLNLKAAKAFTLLNRYEFEGSLIGVLLQGTCTETVVADEHAARAAARAMVQSVAGAEGALRAYRMDNPSWSALLDGATLAWSYVVYDVSQKRWWVMCFADFY